ncbi:hypothetical protein ABZ328_22055 [Micromonospora aurantiaca]|uniref:hypothetical protein n=1 Tax=Micromonospora aurantiaca (nom. illeg.) TaxID=47850 RepID=UPI0033ED1F83
MDLTSLEPVASDAVHEVEPAVMGGVEYPEALKIECSTYDEVTMEYTLGKRYSALSGWVGIQDDASNSYATANIKFTDEKERVLARVSGPYGAPKKISNLDVRSVMRIRIHCRLSDSRKFSSQHHVTLAGMQLKSLS